MRRKITDVAIVDTNEITDSEDLRNSYFVVGIFMQTG